MPVPALVWQAAQIDDDFETVLFVGCSIPGVGRPDPFQGGDGVSNPLCFAGE